MKRIIILLVFNFWLLACSVTACELKINNRDINWWKRSTIYQIYPRSFKDSNGDGIGDLNGITSKLEHFIDAGVDAFWLSPIYTSPQKDFGYDISNFTDISEEYGTLEDFDKLVAKAKSLGLKVLLDFVPNHSSDEHEWFKKSIDRIKPYDEYYIWNDGKKNQSGHPIPPNNWLSVFGGSAWEWNDKRSQFYYHAFTIGQPDLNYRSASLRKEMESVLSFWMHRGVDGFRVDAVNFLFEDPELLDESQSEQEVSENEYEYLDHIYTKDLNDTYDVVQSWSELLDNHMRSYGTDGKVLLMEAYTNLTKSMQYYDAGSNPFNFMFISNLNNDSTAAEFKKTIDVWLNALPENEVTNWVVGNHDNHRVASRFGYDNNRADQITMLSAVLPGITVVYNGDEIGMVDRNFTYEETKDPSGCNAGPDGYYLKSRDPERTPFQWDDTISAGFSNTTNTWLPVNLNYKTLNLKAQKEVDVSHYKVFQALMKLKKLPTIQKGTLEVLLAHENVLAVIRRLAGQPTVALLINFDNITVGPIDANTWLNIPEKLKIFTSSVKSGLAKSGTEVDTTSLTLLGAASVILY